MRRGWLLPLAAAWCAMAPGPAAAGERPGAEEAVGAARPEAEAEGQQECEHAAMRLQALQTRSALAEAPDGPGGLGSWGRDPVENAEIELRDRGNRVFKHTYSSNRALDDDRFMNIYFCPTNTNTADMECAVSSKASCNGFDVHMVQSYVTQNGSETPDEWFSYMSELHGDMTSWDQFMHYGTTFYASDLSDHLRKFQADGVPFMARKTSSDTTLYSLLVQTPSAKIMEIVSTTAPSSNASLFVEWENDECPASHERNISEIKTLSHSLSEIPERRQLQGLPTLTAIGVNIAASAQTVSEIGAWLERYGVGGSASKPKLLSSSSCTVSSITYTNAEVRYVSNPGARVGSKTVEQYEEMQMAAHKQYVGKGAGWDAWMDNHWCIGVKGSMYMDPIAKSLADDGVPWHGHKTERVSSVRTVGLGGESIELNGLSDQSYLKDLRGFDFCTVDTEPPV